jgi:hypothetical protein
METEPDAIKFKYKVVLDGEKIMFITPSSEDFDAGVKNEIDNLVLYSPDNIDDIIIRKINKFFESQKPESLQLEENLGGFKSIRKTAKKNK